MELSLGDVSCSLSAASLVWWLWVEETGNVTACDIFNMRSHAEHVCLESCDTLFGYVENDCYSQEFIHIHHPPSIYPQRDFDEGFYWDA
jgi:hypothetical protein